MAEPPDAERGHEPVQRAAPVRALEQEPEQELALKHCSAVVAAPGAQGAELRLPDGEPLLPDPCYELAGDHPKLCYHPGLPLPRHQQMREPLPYHRDTQPSHPRSAGSDGPCQPCYERPWFPGSIR